jgi:hypothetical protein
VIGEILATFEMLIGQIFLVTLVAGLVSLWRPGAKLPPTEPESNRSGYSSRYRGAIHSRAAGSATGTGSAGARTGSSVALLSLKSASDGTVNAEVASALKHTAAGEADRPRFRLLQRDCWAAEVYAVAHPPADRGRDERTSSAMSCPESRSRRTRLASQWH